MKIKSSSDRRTPLATRLAGLARRWWAIAAYSAILFAGGVLAHRAGWIGSARSVASPTAVKLAVRRAQAMMAPVERLTVDIAWEDFQTLAHHREVALERGVLMLTGDDEVEAEIRHGGRTIPVNVRLKGDLVDHLAGDKWSLRFDTRRDSTLFGMGRFALQHPRTRAFLYERVYHDALKREGLIGLRYDFVDVTVNGRGLGVYALEEQFEKRLIENNRRPEGPIIRFNEDVLWGQLEGQTLTPTSGRSQVAGAGEFQAADIDAFETGSIVSDSAAFRLFRDAIHLLEAFRRGEVSVGDAFDLPKLATFFALTDLLRAWHGAGNWPNVRFYYNPLTARLEPVGYDAYDEVVPARPGLLAVRNRELGDEPVEFPAIFFRDEEFYAAYLAELERMSAPEYLDALERDLSPGLEAPLDVIHREFPEFELTWLPFRQSAEYIRVALHPPKGVQAYVRRAEPDAFEVELGNMQAFPVEVLGLVRDSTELLGPPAVRLEGRLPTEPMRFATAAYGRPEGFAYPDTAAGPLQVRYRVLGTSEERIAPVFDWPHAGLDRIAAGPAHAEPNVESFEFLRVDAVEGLVRVRPGTWRVDRDLVVPPGFRFVAGPGTILDLTSGASLYARGPLELRGEADAPVIVRSSDGSGLGVAVFHAGGPSVLEHVRFENLTNPANGGWALSGAVTFYESPLEARHTRFIDGRSEDGLHIVRTDFELADVSFHGASSDALDIDFGRGTLRDMLFVDSGNDAIDASGSVVEVYTARITGTGDKGVSAGEGTEMLIRDVELEAAAIGLASKDLSHIDAQNVRIRGGQVGVTVFRKKTEFGPASIDARGLQIVESEVEYLLETGSDVTVDGRKLPATREAVSDILYGVEYGRASG